VALRPELSRTEWAAVAQELSGTQLAAVPAGLVARIDDLLAQAPPDWSQQRCALELDSHSAEVVRAVHTALTGLDPSAGQRAAAVGEALQILHDHQPRD
jgi:hypothetical protein